MNFQGNREIAKIVEQYKQEMLEHDASIKRLEQKKVDLGSWVKFFLVLPLSQK